jgi:UTP--glucose-1-phosphate uridylyltransferase
MKAVIPAAGLGTRFLPATKAQPKEMLPLVDKPAIHFVVKEAVDSGIDDILIITGRGKRAIEDYFDRSIELEILLKSKGDKKLLAEIEEIASMADIHYIRQKEARGLGHAILCAEKHVGSEPFVVLLGDDIVFSPVPCTKHCVDYFNKYDSPIVAVESVPKNMLSSYGVVKGKPFAERLLLIEDLVEKPAPEKAPSNYGILGRYVLKPEIFKILKETKPGKNNEIQLTDALRELVKLHKMYAYIIEGKRYDLGNKIDYMKASIDYALNRHEIGPELMEYLKTVVK